MYILRATSQLFASYLQWVPLVRKRVRACWVTPLLHQHEQGARLSAAQRCNEDVLHEIFADLPPRALASAARVCRGWLPTARDRLYQHIFVDNLLPLCPEKLTQTLSTQPLIRSLVRRPVLRHSGIGRRSPALFDWIALLPEHSFISVEIELMGASSKKPLTTLTTLLSLPAIRTTPRLIIRCMKYITPKRLNEVLSMPYLESLSISIPARTAVYLRDITAYPNLRRLSIWVENYPPIICKLLHGLPSPLDRFDLRSKNMNADDIDTLCRALQRHAPHLRHLALFGEPFSTLCFMDDFVSAFSSLEFLLCSNHLYSPELFSRLPPTLTSLALCAPNAWEDPFPADQYAAALQKHRSRLPRLRKVTVVEGRNSLVRCDPIPAVCEAEGIAFWGPAIGSVEKDLLG